MPKAGMSSSAPPASVRGEILSPLKARLRELEEGARAVREPEALRRQPVFLRAGHFAEGTAVAVGQKHRIIAEAGGAARRPHQSAVDAAFEFLHMPVRPRDAER